MYLGGLLHMWIVKHVKELVAFKVVQGGKEQTMGTLNSGIIWPRQV